MSSRRACQAHLPATSTMSRARRRLVSSSCRAASAACCKCAAAAMQQHTTLASHHPPHTMVRHPQLGRNLASRKFCRAIYGVCIKRCACSIHPASIGCWSDRPAEKLAHLARWCWAPLRNRRRPQRAGTRAGSCRPAAAAPRGWSARCAVGCWPIGCSNRRGIPLNENLFSLLW